MVDGIYFTNLSSDPPTHTHPHTHTHTHTATHSSAPCRGPVQRTCDLCSTSRCRRSCSREHYVLRQLCVCVQPAACCPELRLRDKQSEGKARPPHVLPHLSLLSKSLAGIQRAVQQNEPLFLLLPVLFLFLRLQGATMIDVGMGYVGAKTNPGRDTNIVFDGLHG